MNLKEKFEKWSAKVGKGSEKYVACAYAPERHEVFQVCANEKLVLDQMYVEVLDKGKSVKSFYYSAGVESGTHVLPEMAIIIKDEKQVICMIDEEYYSNQNKDNSKEIIILYSSKIHMELIFAAPGSIPYLVADYGTLNGNSEFRFRYAKLLIEGTRTYIAQEHGTEKLPKISVDMDAQIYEEGTDEDE